VEGVLREVSGLSERVHQGAGGGGLGGHRGVFDVFLWAAGWAGAVECEGEGWAGLGVEGV